MDMRTPATKNGKTLEETAPIINTQGGWLQSRSSYSVLSDKNIAADMASQLGEVVDELDGGRDGTSGDGVLGDLVPFVVARSRDQGTSCNASYQRIFPVTVTTDPFHSILHAYIHPSNSTCGLVEKTSESVSGN